MSPKHRIESLDIFRGGAIVLVVLYHFTARLPAAALNMRADPQPAVFFGWIGVFFFFTISGYCIHLTLERTDTVRLFLARRFSRLYPAFVAAVLLLYVFGLFVFIPSVPEAGYRATAPGLVDVALNLILLGDLGEWINGSFWSIAVEVKFYLLVAILAALSGTGGRFLTVFFYLSTALALLWIGAQLLFPPTGALSVARLLQFAAIAPFLPFFALGMIARQHQAKSTRIHLHVLMSFILCLAVLVLTMHRPFTLFQALAVMAVFSLLAWIFIRFTKGRDLPHIPVLSPGMAHIGRVSYSWYLIHETCGFALMAALGAHVPVWLNVMLAVLGTYFIAHVFSLALEWRFRKIFERAALGVLNRLG